METFDGEADGGGKGDEDGATDGEGAALDGAGDGAGCPQAESAIARDRTSARSIRISHMTFGDQGSFQQRYAIDSNLTILVPRGTHLTGSTGGHSLPFTRPHMSI